MRLSLTSSGSFDNFENFLKRDYSQVVRSILNKYGQMGVDALSSATPVESRKTASSWRYKIKTGKKFSSITWYNDNVIDGVNIAVILQYGHGTGTGGWVEGRDYINPALRSIFDRFASELWMEVTRNAKY